MLIELAAPLIAGAAAILAQPLAKATIDAAGEMARTVVDDRVKAVIDSGIDRTRNKLARALVDKARLPQNHDMARAIRIAQLEATRYLLAKVSEEAKRANRQTERGYYPSALNWAEAQLEAVASLGSSVSFVNATSALANRTDASTESAARIATRATWDEMVAAVPNPPGSFEARFFESQSGRGWFDAFQVFLAEQVKTNDRFRDILTSSQLADLRITTDHLDLAVREISAGFQDLVEDIKVGFGKVSEKLDGVATDVTKLARIAADPAPFSIIDEKSRNFSTRQTGHTLPTWSDYATGRVPPLVAEPDVRLALEESGWVCVVGPPSVGKSTLAYRLAIADLKPGQTIHYLDLADLDNHGQAMTAIRTLADRAGYIILDNAHHDPKATNKLYEAWSRSSGVGKLMILVTRTPSDPFAQPKDSLADLMATAVKVDGGPEDFGRVAAFLYLRERGHALPDLPPEGTTAVWRNTFGGQLHAFGFAVLESLSALQQGRWTDLTMALAVSWVKREWIKKLEPEELANANRLAALGTQALELYLPKEALPFPDAGEKPESLLGRIIVCRADSKGRNRVRLAEPGWGELFLKAQELAIDPLLADAASTHPHLAIEISRRLAKAGKMAEREAFWQEMDQRAVAITGRAPHLSPQVLKEFLDEAWRPGRTALSEAVLTALADEVATFALHAFDPPVSHLGALLKQSAERGHDVGPLWKALEDHTSDIPAALGRSPLGHVGGFLKDAAELDLDATVYWDALVAAQLSFADWVRREPLADLAHFVRAAAEAGRDFSPVWTALESVLSDKMMKSSIENLAGFVRAAPLDLLRAAMSDWTSESWGDRLSKRLWGAIWVANACLEIDRLDLARPLLETLIARRSGSHFPEEKANSFYAVILTVVLARQFRIAGHDDFLSHMLPEARLAREYAKEDNAGVICNVLALAAERMNAADRVRLEAGYALRARLRRELASFSQADNAQRVSVIRLLGAANLNGLTISRSTLAGITPSAVEALLTQPPGQHRPTATEIERWQFQMWLGIRAYAQILRRPLTIDAAIISQTLELWTAARATRPDGPMAAVDANMIAWLESGLRQTPPRLPAVGTRVDRLLTDPF